MFKVGTVRTAIPLDGLAAGAFLAALLVFAWALLFRLNSASGIFDCRAADAGLLALSSMWAVMMIAMMIPPALPMILAYANRVSRCEPEGIGLVLVGIFAGVYLIIWVFFGVLAALAQWGLAEAGLVRDGMFSEPVLDGTILVVAGLYQLSAAKAACLARCHAPSALRQQNQDHRTGLAGAARFGLAHGVACVGCCWLLMLLAFVGGSMNLAWMGALTFFVALERVMGVRAGTLRLSGFGLVAAGAAHMLAPAFVLP